jgi:hypothetical protein
MILAITYIFTWTAAEPGRLILKKDAASASHIIV